MSIIIGMSLDENPLLRVTDAGLYCEQGGFFIDPWRPVDRAVVTHAHSDHLCRGCGSYLVARDGEIVTRARLDTTATIETALYGEPIEINGVRVSLHPAGHILGSAQVRLERAGRVWLVSGDYKVDRDLTCQSFEPIICDVFISESTFGLPVYRWPAPSDVFTEILKWWRGNQSCRSRELALWLRPGQGPAPFGGRGRYRRRKLRLTRAHLYAWRSRGNDRRIPRDRH